MPRPSLPMRVPVLAPVPGQRRLPPGSAALVLMSLEARPCCWSLLVPSVTGCSFGVAFFSFTLSRVSV